MEDHLAHVLMDDFAEATGISGTAKARRYLWTDAFALCNFLGLHKQTGNGQYLVFAGKLVEQVHHVLGRHRDDDSRRGWISGLREQVGEQHPTRGGLRIGKTLNERKANEPANAELEWDRDGQYFHYLTKWMHALNRFNQATGEGRYHRWAVELAVTAHKAFTRRMFPGGPKQIVWKMSIDLSRPLVSSMGQHDPLDGLITFLKLQTTGEVDRNVRNDLQLAVADMDHMCAKANWETEDPLGIGGLLETGARLAQLVVDHGLRQRDLLHRILPQAGHCLERFSQSSTLSRPANERLPFRELGFAIGIRALQSMNRWLTQEHELANMCRQMIRYKPLADFIEAFWSDPRHRMAGTWTDHSDINTVMLATSLAPDGYLGTSTLMI